MTRTWQTRWTRLAVAALACAMRAEEALAAEGSGRGTGATVATTETTTVRRIVVSLHSRMLAVVEDDRVLRIFPVAVGAPASPSPVGTFTVVNRVANPTYYGSDGTTIQPGAANPVGTRWMGLSAKGYGIHGTDQPRSIGRAKSHGCIRLRNEDVEQLFELVRTGDTVELVAARTPDIEHLFRPLVSAAATR